jgi:hypothetical protein
MMMLTNRFFQLLASTDFAWRREPAAPAALTYLQWRADSGSILFFQRFDDGLGDAEIFRRYLADSACADKPEGSQDIQLPDIPAERLANPDYRPLPRYWVEQAAVDYAARQKLGGVGSRWLVSCSNSSLCFPRPPSRVRWHGRGRRPLATGYSPASWS